MEPAEIYQRCREKGFDFVTIADHNRIAGALEIAHLPGAFVSAEVTTYFPEDGCKVHILALGIDEEDFAEIQRVRESIYDLRDLLLERDIIHSVAHPFFQANGRLTLDHLEKLLLLFKRFEAINANENRRSVRLASAILRGLTPEVIAEMSERHEIEPPGPEPWKKLLTGGSDDHSGANAGAAYTVTPCAGSVAEFLDHLRHGRHEAAGRPGSTLQFAHGLYRIAYDYYRHRLIDASQTKKRLARTIFQIVMQDEARAPQTLRQRLGALRDRVLLALSKKRLSTVERLLVEELPRLFKRSNGNGTPQGASRDEQVFRTVSQIAQHFSYVVLQRSLEYGREGEVLDLIQAVASLGPVALGVAPYLAAFLALRRDRPLIQEAARRFGLGELVQQEGRPVWMAEVTRGNGRAAHHDALLHSLLKGREPDLAVITCGQGAGPLEVARDFTPVGEIALGRAGPNSLAFPPFLEVIEFIERHEFSEVLISSPGPLGLTGLAAARLLGLKATGIYHGEFCSVVEPLAGDDTIEPLVRRYVAWLLGQMDAVHVAGEDRRYALAEVGLDFDDEPPGPVVAAAARASDLVY